MTMKKGKGLIKQLCGDIEKEVARLYTKDELDEAVKEERERCAQVCDHLLIDIIDPIAVDTVIECVEAIRKRGEK